MFYYTFIYPVTDSLVILLVNLRHNHFVHQMAALLQQLPIYHYLNIGCGQLLKKT